MFGGPRYGTKTSALFAVALAGCQGDYPIAPTACDDWCNTSVEVDCYDYDPASCVADCERQGFMSKPECAGEVDAAMECYRTLSPGERSCSGPRGVPCTNEYSAVIRCLNPPPNPPP